VIPRALVVAFTLAFALVACNRGPEITCKVNDQCFVCPNETARTNCRKDPTSSRCKWAEPSHCK